MSLFGFSHLKGVWKVVAVFSSFKLRDWTNTEDSDRFVHVDVMTFNILGSD